VLSHVAAGLIVATLCHRRKQAEKKDQRIDRAGIKPDVPERYPGSFSLQQPFEAFILLGAFR
jgi:hypothetical protein